MLLPFFARLQVPRHLRNVALVRLSHLDERKLEKIAGVETVIWLDTEDLLALSRKAVKRLEDRGKARKVKLDQELRVRCVLCSC